MTNALELSVPEGVPFIDFTREFDFPVEAVFEAHRDPLQVAQWLGPRRYRIEMDHFDVVTGGSWAFDHVGPDGETYRFRGIFHTVRENEFILQTFEFGGYPDVVSLEYLHFEDLGGGRCRLRGHSVYPSQEARDGMASSGMEEGMSEGYARLDELLATAVPR